MRSAMVLAIGANVVVGHRLQAANATTAAVPTTTHMSKHHSQPIMLGDFRLHGCESSTGGFPNFKKVASTGHMSLDLCAASCPSKFFGVSNKDCFCGDVLDSASTAVDNALCNAPCPGNDEQLCGSYASDKRRREAGSSMILSLYKRFRNGGEPYGTTPPETMTRTVTSTHVATITSCPPEVTNCPVGHKTTSVVTVTTEICPTPEWHKKKIVCYGSDCAPEQPCHGYDCQRYRVICNGDVCRPEVCPLTEEWWHKLVVCNGEQCQYHKCSGEECNTKIICYGDKCAKEVCYGDECNKKFVCKGEECGHQRCNGEDCHTNVICNGQGEGCKPKPPCNGVPPPPTKPCPGPGCPVPPPAPAQPTCSGAGCPPPQPPCTGPGCPVYPPQPPCPGPNCPVVPPVQPCSGPGCPVSPPAKPSCNGSDCPAPPAQPTCTGAGCPPPQPPCTGPGCPVSPPQPPCTGPGCAVPPPSCNGTSCPVPPPSHPCIGPGCPIVSPPTNPCNGTGCPVPPPVVIGGATQIGATILGAVLGFVLLL